MLAVRSIGYNLNRDPSPIATTAGAVVHKGPDRREPREDGNEPKSSPSEKRRGQRQDTRSILDSKVRRDFKQPSSRAEEGGHCKDAGQHSKPEQYAREADFGLKKPFHLLCFLLGQRTALGSYP